MTTNKHNEECGCVEVGMGPYPRYCAKHLKENLPATDVSWENAFDQIFSAPASLNDAQAILDTWKRMQPVATATESILADQELKRRWGMREEIKSFIRKQIDLASKKTAEEWRGGTGRVMYMGGRKEAFGEALKILEEELVLAHTTKSGKTSRLTSAINRISVLEAFSNK